MDYLNEISRKEGYYILTAFSRKTNNSSDVTDFCSHSHETDFLCRNNDSLLSNVQAKDCGYGTCSLPESILKSIVNILLAEPFFRGLIIKFLTEFCQKHYTECFLWCASLLTDFHEKDECLKYMTLALKLKLLAYETEITGNCFDADEATVYSTIVQILNYISVNKLEQPLFISSIVVFSMICPCEDPACDPLYEVLTEILEAANLLRFDFFTCGEPFLVNYKRQSILHHLERFLVLVNYGYEDKYYQNAIREYLKYIVNEDLDWENIYGFDNRTESNKKAHKIFRCYQVLVLYAKKLQSTDYDEFYDEVLHMLWKSITDPFITQREFLSTFERSSSKVVHYVFLRVWKWYEKVVLGGKESVTSPRSLEHLSRCVVRRRLTECFQMPGGIESLYIPTKIKNYLRLKS